MDSADVQSELEHPGARDLIDAAASAHLAYAGKDGSPRVVPVGYWWTGEQFIVSTADTAPKVAALQERPEVALSIETGDSPEGARALSVRGTAAIEIVDGVVPEYLQAARKNMPAEAAEQFAQQCEQMYDRMARIAITPHWARFYDYGSGRMPAFLMRLAEKAGGQ